MKRTSLVWFLVLICLSVVIPHFVFVKDKTEVLQELKTANILFIDAELSVGAKIRITHMHEIELVRSIFLSAKKEAAFNLASYPTTPCTISFILDNGKSITFNISQMITKSLLEMKYEVFSLNYMVFESKGENFISNIDPIKAMLGSICEELNKSGVKLEQSK